MHALLRHLPHFGPIDIALTPDGEDAVAPAREAAPDLAFSHAELEHAAAEARRSALAEARAALEACEAARMEDARRFEAALEERLEAARAEWCRVEADRLADAVKSAFCDLDARLGARLAAILTPFVGGALRARALNEMTNRLTTLLAKGGRAPTLTVSGPADLLAALRERLGHPVGVAFQEDAGVDLRATCEDTLIETQLEAWAAILDGHDGQGGVRVRQG